MKIILGGFYNKNVYGRTGEQFSDKLNQGYLLSFDNNYIYFGFPASPSKFPREKLKNCLIRRRDFLTGYELVKEPQYGEIRTIMIDGKHYANSPSWARRENDLNEVRSL